MDQPPSRKRPGSVSEQPQSKKRALSPPARMRQLESSVSELENTVADLEKKRRRIEILILASGRKLQHAKYDLKQYPIRLYNGFEITEERWKQIQLPAELVSKIIGLYLKLRNYRIGTKNEASLNRLYPLCPINYQALIAFKRFSMFLRTEVAYGRFKQFGDLAMWARKRGNRPLPGRNPGWVRAVHATSVKALAEKLPTRRFVLRKDKGKTDPLLRITIFGPKGFVDVETQTSLHEGLMRNKMEDKTVKIGWQPFDLVPNANGFTVPYENDYEGLVFSLNTQSGRIKVYAGTNNA